MTSTALTVKAEDIEGGQRALCLVADLTNLKGRSKSVVLEDVQVTIANLNMLECAVMRMLGLPREEV